ncbi:MAG: UDP-GlcNAc--UDP-phosphate GlcNAc-1-phosphate transferase [Bacteroidia bacterium]|nr:UDP-GlcNAc--UDP-phosphate GlcNAc-1-phosphate transferase [Bacteroidia bacterium]
MKNALKRVGVVFYVALLLSFLVTGYQYPWFFIGLTLITLLSLMEDIKPQHWRLRMNVHTMAMLLMLYQWGLFQHYLIYGFMALIFCMWMVNAYTMMDEGHGMTVMHSLVTVLALWYINVFQKEFIHAGIIEALIPALVIFGTFNFCKKPKIKPNFVGSVALAYTIVFLISMLVIKRRDFSPVVLLAVYGVDTVLTFGHRFVKGEAVFRNHRLHLFQLLVDRVKLSPLLVAGIYSGIQALISIGFIFTHHRYWYALAVFVVCSAVYIYIRARIFKGYQIEIR